MVCVEVRLKDGTFGAETKNIFLRLLFDEICLSQGMPEKDVVFFLVLPYGTESALSASATYLDEYNLSRVSTKDTKESH